MNDSAIVRKWGNSLGLTLSKETVKREKIKPHDRVIVSVKKVTPIKELFGTLKSKRSTESIMKEIDEGWK